MTFPGQLDRYQLLEQIGEGGMGTVFACRHDALAQPLAIKILHSHLVTDEMMARRMVEEAHTLSTLDHPGIVEVFDVGATADGRTFVVMERLIGESLGDRLSRGRLSERYAVGFGRQIASALHAAHTAGVIHRDLKPDNVFIEWSPDVAGEQVKILDFGIAKRDGASRDRTETGVALGTPAFMAPEQSAGRRDLDGRVDVYALGVLLYAMVSGELPFSGANTDEMFAEHAFCRPPKAAATSPVSHELSAIIERCLAKRPEDRFATMADVAAALERVEANLAAPYSLEGKDTTPERSQDPAGPTATTNLLPFRTPHAARVPVRMWAAVRSMAASLGRPGRSVPWLPRGLWAALAAVALVGAVNGVSGNQAAPAAPPIETSRVAPPPVTQVPIVLAPMVTPRVAPATKRRPAVEVTARADARPPPPKRRPERQVKPSTGRSAAPATPPTEAPREVPPPAPPAPPASPAELDALPPL